MILQVVSPIVNTQVVLLGRVAQAPRLGKTHVFYPRVTCVMPSTFLHLPSAPLFSRFSLSRRGSPSLNFNLQTDHAMSMVILSERREPKDLSFQRRAHEQNQRCRLRIRLGPALLPFLQRPFVDPQRRAQTPPANTVSSFLKFRSSIAHFASRMHLRDL